MLMGGDFNERTGEREARNWEGDGKRISKDKVETRGRRRRMDCF
jgi:hypothetical protein